MYLSIYLVIYLSFYLYNLCRYDLMSEAGDVELAVLDDDILPYGVHRDDIFGIRDVNKS